MRRPVAILVGAILLAIVVWFFERPDQLDKGDFEPTLLCPELKPDDITKIEVDYLVSGSLLKKDGDVWRVLEEETEMSKQLSEEKKSGEAKSFKADAEKIEKILKVLSELKAISIVSSNPEKRTTFQVGKMGKNLKLYNEKGDRVVDLIIGKQNTSVLGTYVRKQGENTVYQVNEFLNAMIPADVMSWRDKKILDLPLENITGARILKKDQTGEIEYAMLRDEDNQWSVVEPEKVSLDQEKVYKLFDKIAKVDAARFALIIDKDLTGLEDPAIEIDFDLSDGKKATLLVGGQDKQGYLYARLKENGDEIYLLPSNFTSKVPFGWENLMTDKVEGDKSEKTEE